ncbi:hypothetical protein D3C76_1686420 [compost metagenome]
MAIFTIIVRVLNLGKYTVDPSIGVLHIRSGLPFKTDCTFQREIDIIQPVIAQITKNNCPYTYGFRNVLRVVQVWILLFDDL